MCKSKRKKENSYNQTALTAVAKKYGMTKMYIRQVLRGDRDRALIADQVKKDYKQKVKEVEALINDID